MHRALQGRCGLFCGDCEIYIAYSTNDKKTQGKIAREYNQLKGKSVTPEQVKCLGCKSTTPSIWRNRCQIRLCAEERGVEFCYQCLDYPCNEIQKFLEKHPQARENLRTISKIGPDAWLSMMLNKDKSPDDE